MLCRLWSLLGNINELFTISRQDARLRDETHVASRLVNNRQHPSGVLLEAFHHAGNLLVNQNLVGRLNHIFLDVLVVLRAIEHIVTYVVQLHHAQQFIGVVHHGKDVTAATAHNFHNIAKRIRRGNLHEVGFHKLVDVQEHHNRRVLVVGEQQTTFA